MTRDMLASLLSYDPETGEFTRVIGRGPQSVGDRAGTVNGQGYRQITLFGRIVGEHRLAVLWMTGVLPAAEVDHINLNKSDNRWANLRVATRSQNMANRPLDRMNTSGLKGVAWHARARKWAQIQVNGNSVFLGLYTCPAAARFAYLIASDKAFGAFARAA